MSHQYTHRNGTTRSGQKDASASIRRGIEVEYWVIDSAGQLTDAGPLVEAAAGAEREFVKPLLEIKTTPCKTTTAMRTELYDHIRRVLDRADELDLGLVPLATPLTHEDIQELPSDRTRIQNLVVGDSFKYARNCAGTHIHVEQLPGRELDQFNTLLALDPALALVNSAPYFEGRQLAIGARSKLYREMAYQNIPNQGDLWPYLTDLDEWTNKLDQRYTAFSKAAIAEGVSQSRVESCFDPESSVWTPVKFRESFGTVEWRAPDAALPSQVIQLADNIMAIMDHLAEVEVRIEGSSGGVTEDSITLPEFDSLMDYATLAIADGLDSQVVRSYLSRMGFTVEKYRPLSHELAGRDWIPTEEVQQLRLDYAKRLIRDVRSGAEKLHLEA